MSNKGEIYNTEYFFSQPKFVILETIAESLIAEISKIYIKDNYLYILDKKSQKVLIFNDQGKFVRSIKNRGNGPGEYIQLIDFSLDNKGRLVLYSDIPGKIIFYSNTGDFLYEKKLKETYLSMSIVDELIYFQNLPTKKYTVTMLDLSNDKKIKLLKSLPEYNNVFLKGYSISSNTNIILTRRFDPLVYSISNDSVKTLYKIDFGKSFITKDFLSKYAKSKDFFKKCFDNNFVFTYINTQLIKNKLVFNTNHALMHI
ncbi:MAG: 6-bladed beta-propeller, partial [Rikenellaceae bacterium]